MKSEWTVLLVSAFTDLLLAVGATLTAAMMGAEVVAVPSTGVMILAAISGITAAARTVQQALKMTPSAAANLRGSPSMTVTADVSPTTKP